jgi:FkbM family methyltransferase
VRTAYEPWAEVLFSVIFSLRGGTFVDVGANVGQTLLRVLSLDPDREYFGFEPQLSACLAVDSFINTNHLRRHAVLPIGLSDRTGIVHLGTRRTNDVTASIIAEYRPSGFYRAWKWVVVATGDEVLSLLNVSSVCLIKIDVEGAELEVMLGFERTIHRRRPYIVFEVLPDYLHATQSPLDESIAQIRAIRRNKIYRLLLQNDYQVFRVDQERLTEIECLAVSGRRLYNCVAVPSEELVGFQEKYELMNRGAQKK